MENEIFSTRDLTLAATLVTLKFYITRVDYTVEGDRNRPVGYFVFEKTQALKDAEIAYKRGEILVEPRTYQTNIHSLKAEVMNYLKSPHSNH